MLPIVDIPLVVQTFCLQFRNVFKHIVQYDHFQAFITALSVSENKTIAGIQQRFVDGPTYESMHHFMSNSPWSVEELRKCRLQYVKERLASKPNNAHNVQLLAMKRDTVSGAIGLSKAKEAPRICSIDATFVHHTGEAIYGVYWFHDYAKRCYTLAQRLVLSTLVTPANLVPLGWKLYHRGFLEEQKAYLEEVAPEPDADEAVWAEYDKLIEKYEQNQREHKTQNELAGELVDECEQSDLSVEVYVCDAALAGPELMDKIEEGPGPGRSNDEQGTSGQCPDGGEKRESTLD
jgi:hypothetical protein